MLSRIVTLTYNATHAHWTHLQSMTSSYTCLGTTRRLGRILRAPPSGRVELETRHRPRLAGRRKKPGQLVRPLRGPFAHGTRPLLDEPEHQLPQSPRDGVLRPNFCGARPGELQIRVGEGRFQANTIQFLSVIQTTPSALERAQPTPLRPIVGETIAVLNAGEPILRRLHLAELVKNNSTP